MATFLGKHTIPGGIDKNNLTDSWDKYKEAAKAKGLTPVHVNISVEQGFAYCETEAGSQQEVLDAHKDAGVPVDEVIEVVLVK